MAALAVSAAAGRSPSSAAPHRHSRESGNPPLANQYPVSRFAAVDSRFRGNDGGGGLRPFPLGVCGGIGVVPPGTPAGVLDSGLRRNDGEGGAPFPLGVCGGNGVVPPDPPAGVLDSGLRRNDGGGGGMTGWLLRVGGGGIGVVPPDTPAGVLDSGLRRNDGGGGSAPVSVMRIR